MGPAGKSGKDFECVFLNLSVTLDCDLYSTHNLRGRGRDYEAKSTRPPTSRPLGKSGENFECVTLLNLSVTLDCDHYSPHNPRGRGRVFEAESTRPPTSRYLGKSGENFEFVSEAKCTLRPTLRPLGRSGENFEFSMTTNLKWLSSTRNAAQILNLSNHFRPNDSQGRCPLSRLGLRGHEGTCTQGRPGYPHAGGRHPKEAELTAGKCCQTNEAE
jgi:hypothetical protein